MLTLKFKDDICRDYDVDILKQLPIFNNMLQDCGNEDCENIRSENDTDINTSTDSDTNSSFISDNVINFEMSHHNFEDILNFRKDQNIIRFLKQTIVNNYKNLKFDNIFNANAMDFNFDTSSINFNFNLKINNIINFNSCKSVINLIVNLDFIHDDTSLQKIKTQLLQDTISIIKYIFINYNKDKNKIILMAKLLDYDFDNIDYQDIKLFWSVLDQITGLYNVNNIEEDIISELVNLTKIKFAENFNQKVDNLPPSLHKLQFGWSFNQKVDNLPPTLQHLTFGWYFNKNVDNLPPTLQHLTFGNNFNQTVDNLPPTLQKLTFGHFFTKNIDNLPPFLQQITFNKPNSFMKEQIKSLSSSIKIILK